MKAAGISIYLARKLAPKIPSAPIPGSAAGFRDTAPHFVPIYRHLYEQRQPPDSCRAPILRRGSHSVVGWG